MADERTAAKKPRKLRFKGIVRSIRKAEPRLTLSPEEIEQAVAITSIYTTEDEDA